MCIRDRWATLRLIDLEEWVEDWRENEMFAGTKGQGAADGAYEAGITIELCKLLNVEYTGGAADIYKCFDQMDRSLLYELLKIGGMPDRIRDTYASYLENMVVHNTVAGGVGEPYRKPFFHTTGVSVLHDGNGFRHETVD